MFCYIRKLFDCINRIYLRNAYDSSEDKIKCIEKFFVIQKYFDLF